MSENIFVPFSFLLSQLFVCFLFYLFKQKNLIIEEPRQRRQTARYGNQDLFKVSDIDSDSDYEESGGEEKKVVSTGKKRGRKKGSGRRKTFDEDFEIDDPIDGSYSRAELFKVEKNLLVYG